MPPSESWQALLETLGLEEDDVIDCATDYRDQPACSADHRCEWFGSAHLCEWSQIRKAKAIANVCRKVTDSAMRQAILADIETKGILSSEILKKLRDIELYPDAEASSEAACHRIISGMATKLMEIPVDSPEEKEFQRLVEMSSEEIRKKKRHSPMPKTLLEEWRAVPLWSKRATLALASPFLLLMLFFSILLMTAGCGFLFSGLWCHAERSLARLVPTDVIEKETGQLLYSSLDYVRPTDAEIWKKVIPQYVTIFAVNILGITGSYQLGGIIYFASNRIKNWISSWWENNNNNDDAE